MESERIIEVTCSMKKEVYRLVWNIEGFNMMPFVRDHPLFGPSIRLGKEEDSTWQLMLVKQRGDDDKLPSVGVKLFKTEDNDVWDICRYDVTIGSQNGDIKLVVVKNELSDGDEDHLSYVFVKGDQEKVYRNEDGEEQPSEDSPFKARNGTVQERVEPESSEKLMALFKEPILVVECDIRYTYVSSDMDATDDCQERLLVEDLVQLYKSQKFSDLILRAGEKEFKVHKSVLCSRAPGFRAHILDDRDRPKKELVLEETELATRDMLKFVYSGEFPEKMTVEDNYNLYAAAKKYGLHPLADYCVKCLRCLFHREPFEGSDDVRTKIQEILESEKDPTVETIKVFT